MDPTTELSKSGHHLLLLLQRAQNKSTIGITDTLHVGGTGKDIYFAYERLRNAAEYTQQHLLLRAAIERFLRRTMPLRHGTKSRRLARDLVIELTNARYLPNDSISGHTLETVNHFIHEYTQFFHAITAYNGIHRDVAARWTYHITSVSVERLLQPQEVNDALIDFAYRHYLQAINRRDFADVPDDQYAAAVFCAMQQALFNADKATTISCWLSLTCANSQKLDDFVAACQTIDTYFDNPLTNKLSRLINRYGAPLRVVRELITRQPGLDLRDQKKVLTELEQTTLEQYESTQKRLMHSIKRAVIFIIITKLLVGLLIEVPLDIVFLGQVAIVPIVLTLLLPTAYLLSATYSLRRPSPRNTHTILDHAARILYKASTPVTYNPRLRAQKNRTLLNTVYISLVIIVLALVGWSLAQVGFHIVHTLIFFLFLSATSLLRFRIVQSARELEIVDRQQSMFGVVGDLLYLPFIHLGQWLSDSYRQINFIAYALDLAIEMPLKTMLRALRTWVDFIRDKREEI